MSDLADDEVIRFYLASKDWRMIGPSTDADTKSEIFKMHMATFQLYHDNGDLFGKPVYDPIHRLGMTPAASSPWGGPQRSRIAIKFKIPDAPHKGMYPRQVILFLPYDSSTAVIDNAFNPSIMVGKYSGFKFGNDAKFAEYDTDIEGKTPPTDSIPLDKFYSELGFGMNLDGKTSNKWKVKQPLPTFHVDAKYPLGGTGVSSITEISPYDYALCNGYNTSDKWWALNFSPMCYADNWAAGDEHEFLLWHMYDMADETLMGGVAESLFLEIWGPGYIRTGTFPNPGDITDNFDDTLWAEGGPVTIDGLGGDFVTPSNKSGPLLAVLWKFAEDANTAYDMAGELTLEPTEDRAIANFSWSPSEDTDFLAYRLGSCLMENPLSVQLGVSSDNQGLDKANLWIPMGYYPGMAIGEYNRVHFRIQTLIGGDTRQVATIKLFSNPVLGYRPFLEAVRNLGPELYKYVDATTNLRPTLSGGKLINNDINDKLYPVGAGIDSFQTPDNCQTYVEYSCKDVNLTAPPGGEVLGDFYYVNVGSGGAWAGQDGKVAEVTGVGPTTWGFYDLDVGAGLYNQANTTHYAKQNNLTLDTKGWKKIVVFKVPPNMVDYVGGMDLVFMRGNYSERASSVDFQQIGTGAYVIYVDWLDAFFDFNTFIWVIRRQITGVHFLFDDEGKGYTDEIFEMDVEFQDDPGGILSVSETSFLKVGDRVVIMDGLKPYLKIIASIEGNLLTFTSSTGHNFPARTQVYKCPEYLYTKSGDVAFSMAFESEDGFISDWVANEYDHTIGDIPPIASISAEKLLVKTGETFRVWGMESYLFDQTQVLGQGNARYEFQFNGGGWWLKNVPYIDLFVSAAGPVLVELRVRNDNLQYSPIVSMTIEVVDEIVSGYISDIINITDFSNFVLTEGIIGGRDVQADENIAGDEKTFDSVTKSVRKIRLSGLASTRHATHPIAKVNVWRNTLPVAFQELPDDLVTLLYGENHQTAFKFEIEGEEKYMLMGNFSRDRDWSDLEKRHWNADFTIVE